MENIYETLKMWLHDQPLMNNVIDETIYLAWWVNRYSLAFSYQNCLLNNEKWHKSSNPVASNEMRQYRTNILKADFWKKNGYTAINLLSLTFYLRFHGERLSLCCGEHLGHIQQQSMDYYFVSNRKRVFLHRKRWPQLQ